MKFLKNWLKRKKRRNRREERIQVAEQKGYRILQIENQRSNGYRVVTPDGSEISNDGMGFATSSDAFNAVIKHERKEKLQAPRDDGATLSR